jgi:hypothetical protein
LKTGEIITGQIKSREVVEKISDNLRKSVAKNINSAADSRR